MSELVLRDVTICYGPDPAVHHLDLALPLGALVALLGPNGAGKSTLLRGILGGLPLTTGSIELEGAPLTSSLGRVAFLPQRREHHAEMPLSVREVVEMGRYPRLGLFRRFRDGDHAAVDAAIAEMGLDRLQLRRFAELSGGQAQRVLLARALVTGADVFLLDEPFAGLDAAAVAALSSSLQAWARRGRLVIAVVHDLALVRRVFDRAVLMRNHLVAAGSPADVLTQLALQGAFGSRAAAAEAAAGDRV